MSERFNPFESPLIAGRLDRRYKRFLADITLNDGTQIVAHCPNSGSMMGMSEPSCEVMVRRVDDPKRKLKWTWELVRPFDTTSWVGCNTMRPNQIVGWAIETGQIPGLSASNGMRREVPYGNRSRIDILLGQPHDLTYVEVKNTTLIEGTTAMFPDAVTARGAKHMQELQAMVSDGHRALVVFLVNRSDATSFDVARSIDPTYAGAFDDAVAGGVEVLALGTDVTPQGWKIRGPLEL